MTTPSNTFQNVQTYQAMATAFFENASFCVKHFNKKFDNFQNLEANLGDTVTWQAPPRFVSAPSLIANWQGAQQTKYTLTVDQANNTSFQFTNQQRLFNLDNAPEFRKSFMGAAVIALANDVEINVAKNADSSVPVMQQVGPDTQPTGALHTESGPYMFYGNGTTEIKSYQQLRQAVVNYKNRGSAASGNIKVVLPDVIIPSVIGTGLNQFAPMRNDEIANSWELGEFGKVEWFSSNVLPEHISGVVGNASAGGNILTVVSTNDPTGANITQITFSGAGTSVTDAILSGDLAQFNDGVSGKPNVRFMLKSGTAASKQPVQIRFTSDQDSTGGGQVTCDIFPALCSVNGPNRNISQNIVAGMKVTVAPSHQCGLLIDGNAGFLAMPKLPDQIPYPTASAYNEETGCSLRLTWGSLFGQNQQGSVFDEIHGSFVAPDYCQRIIFPLSQTAVSA